MGWSRTAPMGPAGVGAAGRRSATPEPQPVDTAATLLAAWHGIDTAAAAGALLAQDKPDGAVLARNRDSCAGVDVGAPQAWSVRVRLTAVAHSRVQGGCRAVS